MYNQKNPVIANHIGAVQGDVPIVRIDDLPQNAVKSKSRIVALGEATGHHHIIDGTVKEAEIYTDAIGNLFALVKKEVKVLHQEHAPVILEPGVYRFGLDGFQQVEYDGEEERRVLD